MGEYYVIIGYGVNREGRPIRAYLLGVYDTFSEATEAGNTAVEEKIAKLKSGHPKNAYPKATILKLVSDDSFKIS